MTDKPTNEQVKEFWEWCGWEYVGITNSATSGLVYAPRHTWKYLLKAEHTITSPTTGKPRIVPAFYETYFGQYPNLDLNNLFKYAVPKLPYVVLENCQAGYRASVSADMKYNPEFYDKDPAIALFKAIQEVIHG